MAMTETLLLYAITAAVFLMCDAVALRAVMKPVFTRYLGRALLDAPRYGPAVAFYLFYVVGVLVFAGLPALAAGSATMALWKGALLGAVAYGTYEFTNLATLRDWHWKMVALDWTWGTVLTGVSAGAGVAILLAIG
jgi:uncharacterized membrane protein